MNTRHQSCSNHTLLFEQVSRGNYYAISFSAVRTCAQDEKLNVSVSTESGMVPMQTIYSSSGWDSYAWGFMAKRYEVDLVIHNPGVDDDTACGPLIDSVAIQTLHPPRLTKCNHHNVLRLDTSFLKLCFIVLSINHAYGLNFSFFPLN